MYIYIYIYVQLFKGLATPSIVLIEKRTQSLCFRGLLFPFAAEWNKSSGSPFGAFGSSRRFVENAFDPKVPRHVPCRPRSTD